jgi:sensor c-di-GMP phosphodiesterase-like protein
MIYILGIITGLLIGITVVLLERKYEHKLTEHLAEKIEKKEFKIIKEPVKRNDALIDLLNGKPIDYDVED